MHERFEYIVFRISGLIEGHFFCTSHFFKPFLFIQRKKGMYTFLSLISRKKRI